MERGISREEVDQSLQQLHAKVFCFTLVCLQFTFVPTIVGNVHLFGVAAYYWIEGEGLDYKAAILYMHTWK